MPRGECVTALTAEQARQDFAERGATSTAMHARAPPGALRSDADRKRALRSFHLSNEVHEGLDALPAGKRVHASARPSGQAQGRSDNPFNQFPASPALTAQWPTQPSHARSQPEHRPHAHLSSGSSTSLDYFKLDSSPDAGAGTQPGGSGELQRLSSGKLRSRRARYRWKLLREHTLPSLRSADGGRWLADSQVANGLSQSGTLPNRVMWPVKATEARTPASLGTRSSFEHSHSSPANIILYVLSKFRAAASHVMTGTLTSASRSGSQGRSSVLLMPECLLVAQVPEPGVDDDILECPRSPTMRPMVPSDDELGPGLESAPTPTALHMTTLSSLDALMCLPSSNPPVTCFAVLKDRHSDSEPSLSGKGAAEEAPAGVQEPELGWSSDDSMGLQMNVYTRPAAAAGPVGTTQRGRRACRIHEQPKASRMLCATAVQVLNRMHTLEDLTYTDMKVLLLSLTGYVCSGLESRSSKVAQISAAILAVCNHHEQQSHFPASGSSSGLKSLETRVAPSGAGGGAARRPRNIAVRRTPACSGDWEPGSDHSSRQAALACLPDPPSPTARAVLQVLQEHMIDMHGLVRDDSDCESEDMTQTLPRGKLEAQWRIGAHPCSVPGDQVG